MSSYFDRVLVGKALTGFEVSVLENLSFIRCAFACQMNVRCKSINHDVTSRRCTVSSETAETYPSKVINAPTVSYYTVFIWQGHEFKLCLSLYSMCSPKQTKASTKTIFCVFSNTIITLLQAILSCDAIKLEKVYTCNDILTAPPGLKEQLINVFLVSNCSFSGFFDRCRKTLRMHLHVHHQMM